MNPYLQKLQPYPFEKLRNLFSQGTENTDLTKINLSVGEPKNPIPSFIKDVVKNNLHTYANYPVTRGSDELRESLVRWLCKRFSIPPSAISSNQHVLPVNGTREALFAIAQTCIDASQPANVILPNPFYQIYEGAALLAGARPVFVDFSVKDGEVPGLDNVDEETWKKTQLVYICTPSNPSGDVLPETTIKRLLDLAQKHDFVIASDECYSEIYYDEKQPPKGLLQVAYENGYSNFEHCIAFYSLSKRSNAPGLRSGFVAGDQKIIKEFLKYRTYHGCAMPVSTQLASIAAWDDEDHVIANRATYRTNFENVVKELSKLQPINIPPAGFYIWLPTPILPTPIDDEQFALGLYSQQNITVLPGKYLAREVNHQNPGTNHVRIALVASPAECITAAQRINQFIESLS